MILKNKVFRYIIFWVVTIATFYFAYLIREVVFTFLAGGLLAYLLFRPIAFFEWRGLSRVWAIFIVYLLLAVLLALLLWFAIPRLAREMNEAASMLPGYAAKLQDFSSRIHNLHLPGKLDLMLKENTIRIENYIYSLLRGMVNGIYLFLSKALILVFAPILAIYIIKDWEKIKTAFLTILPPSARRDAITLISKIDDVCIEYLKGHLLVSGLVGLVTGIAAWIIGIDFALVIGIIAGLTDLIPYFGPILGGLPALMLALSQSWRAGLYMAIAIILIQHLEANVLTPKIIGERLGMHPLVIVFALLAGGELLGILGMLIALPLTAALRIIISFVYLKFVD